MDKAALIMPQTGDVWIVFAQVGLHQGALYVRQWV